VNCHFLPAVLSSRIKKEDIKNQAFFAIIFAENNCDTQSETNIAKKRGSYAGVQSINDVFHNVNKVENFIDDLILNLIDNVEYDEVQNQVIYEIFDLIDIVEYVVYALYSSMPYFFKLVSNCLPQLFSAKFIAKNARFFNTKCNICFLDRRA
jgi:hypothetical protein